MNLRYTLLADGSSDRALMPILNWSVAATGIPTSVQEQWADLGNRPRVPKSLQDKIRLNKQLYPSDVLFVHRDCERETLVQREEEIRAACGCLESDQQFSYIPVTPVRMSEAWLLFSESAIRHAAGNPNGSVILNMPKVTFLEQIADPKDILFGLLKSASGLSGRRLSAFDVNRSRRRVAEFVSDFSPLRALESFRRLEENVAEVLSQLSS